MNPWTREQILSSLSVTDKDALRKFEKEGAVPLIPTLVKLIRLGLIEKTPDGYAAKEG